MKRLFPILFLALVLVRVPSVVQPAGSDQGLYAYVGQAIARGEVPYRDAWDQKPPAVHFTYALMYAVWPDDSIVAVADIVAAVGVALLLVALGRRLSGGRGPGEAAALLFLLLANPSFLRLSGMYVRAQCETFIGLLAVAALLLIADGVPRPSEYRRLRPLWLFAAGVLLGLAFLFKYNAGAYFAAAGATAVLLVFARGDRRGLVAWAAPVALLAAGFVVPIGLAFLYFLRAGALGDLYQATIAYNLKYSSETYGGRLGLLGYLVTFPVRHALWENDSLWLLGGLGTAALLVMAGRDRLRLVMPIWVAAACLSIAINGGRGLPQYFIQASPLLALAAGLAGALAWNAFARVPRVVLVAALVFAVVRVSPFDKAIDNTRFDLRYLRGGVSAPAYLARFASDRYSAVALRDLAAFLKSTTRPDERVFVFGFSGMAYVRAGRQSASRFFWSRPILVGFNEGVPGYGAAGLLDDLSARHPAVVVLQQHDWPAEGIDSATYFTRHPRLGPWLQARYELTSRNDTYQIWRRRAGV
jgi:4-amino-4-deoxy-L-arabinose transferase-like glycosyltransferase